MNEVEVLPTVTWGYFLDYLRNEMDIQVEYPVELNLQSTIGIRAELWSYSDLIQWACIEYPVLITYHKEAQKISIEWTGGWGVETVDMPVMGETARRPYPIKEDNG